MGDLLSRPAAPHDFYGNTFPPHFFGPGRREGVLPVRLVSHVPTKLTQEVNYVTHDGGATWQFPQPK